MQVLLSLGSNMGNRTVNLEVAVQALDRLEGVTVGAVSNTYETEAWGDPGQPGFLNLAVEIETAIEPLELLNAVKKIERDGGRRPAPHWGPRVLDIDIILWGAAVMSTPELTVPHSEFRNRAFVLRPLAEIAGHAVDPVSGLTVSELAARPEARGRVERVGMRKN